MPSLPGFAIAGTSHGAALDRNKPTPQAELSVAFSFGRAIEAEIGAQKTPERG
jgi:hypothetical protein